VASLLLKPFAMNSKSEELKKRTKKFALDVISFVRQLHGSDETKDIGRQLLRSGTGAGSNYRAKFSRNRASLQEHH